VLLEHPARSNRIHDVITYIRQHLGTELTVEKLADVARMSKRQFTRRFKDETGLTPAKAVDRIRLETARDFLSSSWTIDTIARETDTRIRAHEALLRGARSAAAAGAAATGRDRARGFRLTRAGGCRPQHGAKRGTASSARIVDK
jgi:hypothetical protein